MKILLINVSLRPTSKLKLFPIGLGYIATSLKMSNIDFDLLDIDVNRYSTHEINIFLENNKYDLICMGCIVTGYKYIKALSTLIKKINPSCNIVVGNSVASSIPNILLKNTSIDIAVDGEGDETIVEIVNCLKNRDKIEKVLGIYYRDQLGNVVFTGTRKQISNISSLPFIDFSIFDVESYIQGSSDYISGPLPIPKNKVRALPVNTARGCIGKCGFCYHVFKNVPYRYRSSKSIIDEIRLLIDKYNINFISFWDDLTFFSKKQLNEFLEEVIKSKLSFYWRATCRADLFNNDSDIETILRMKENGCVGIGYSLESSDNDILCSMHKNITVDQFEKQTTLFHAANMPILTSLVFGYPQETPETIKATFDCCIKNKIYPSVGYLLPQPGSEMYDFALKNGFIHDEEKYILSMGDRQDLLINMTKMRNDEFIRCVTDGLKKCNEALNIGLSDEKLIKTSYSHIKA